MRTHWRLAASETIFGTDELGQLTTYNSILSERLKELRRIYDEYVRMRYDYYESVYGELFTSGELQASTTTIQSDNRTWLQKIFGSNKNVSAFNLAALFDEAGNIDWDMYESLLAWYDQYSEGIDESHRQMLDDMIAQIDAYKEALDGIREFANSLFGNVASDVADAVLSGTGNLEAEMDEILADINRKVVKAMIENRVIADVFNDDLQEDIIEALKNGDVALANQLFQGGGKCRRDRYGQFLIFNGKQRVVQCLAGELRHVLGQGREYSDTRNINRQGCAEHGYKLRHGCQSAHGYKQ